MVTSVPSSSKIRHFLQMKARELARDFWILCVEGNETSQYQSKLNAIGTGPSIRIGGELDWSSVVC